MQELCCFLDVPFEPQMASLEGADRSATFSGQHHAQVRGNRIIRRGRNAEALAPAVREKITHYICRWAKQSRGDWPKYTAIMAPGSGPPKMLELLRDRVAYRALLCGDGLVKLTYAITPLTAANSIRSLLRQHTYAKSTLQTSR